MIWRDDCFPVSGREPKTSRSVPGGRGKIFKVGVKEKTGEGKGEEETS